MDAPGCTSSRGGTRPSEAGSGKPLLAHRRYLTGTASWLASLRRPSRPECAPAFIVIRASKLSTSWKASNAWSTPGRRRKLQAGETYVVPVGPHVQAATRGRKNLALILFRPGELWMTPATDWTPSQF